MPHPRFIGFIQDSIKEFRAKGHQVELAALRLLALSLAPQAGNPTWSSSWRTTLAGGIFTVIASPHWRMIDPHTPMKQALAAERAKNPAFAFAKDGVHPDEHGHWLMAKTILTALGAKDLNGITTASAIFPDQAAGKELLRLIHQQSSVMKDAWLTEIGHKRPQKAGLPLPEARKQAADIEKQIRKFSPPSQ